MATYVEQDELPQYICRNCVGLLTPFEREVLQRVSFEHKRKAYGEEWWLRFRAESKAPISDDPAILAAVADWPEYRRKMCARLVAEHGDQLLNRCPECQAIRATPQAKFCMWCFHDERHSR